MPWLTPLLVSNTTIISVVGIIGKQRTVNGNLGVTGLSVSKPHTSEFNGGISLTYIIVFICIRTIPSLL